MGLGVGAVADGEAVTAAVGASVGVAIVALGELAAAVDGEIRATSAGTTSAIPNTTYSAKPTRCAVLITLARGHAPDGPFPDTATHTRIEGAVKAA